MWSGELECWVSLDLHWNLWGNEISNLSVGQFLMGINLMSGNSGISERVGWVLDGVVVLKELDSDGCGGVVVVGSMEPESLC